MGSYFDLSLKTIGTRAKQNWGGPIPSPCCTPLLHSIALSGIHLVYHLGRNFILDFGGEWHKTWDALRDMSQDGGALSSVKCVGTVRRDDPVASLVNYLCFHCNSFHSAGYSHTELVSLTENFL